MSNTLIQRARKPEDDVVSTGTAAEMLNRKRQGVDQGVRQGRIPGFRDPTAKRVWVQRSWVLEQLGTGPVLADRVQKLEENESTARESHDDLVTDLRSKIADANEINRVLLAAAAHRDRADDLAGEAVELEAEAAKKRREAEAERRRERTLFREALGLSQIPSDASGITEQS